jgi:hypothetical protein
MFFFSWLVHTGHISRECTQAVGAPGGGRDGQGYYKCNSQGHNAYTKLLPGRRLPR